MGEPSLIINADDFGYDQRINLAILASFEKGLCSSTTVMPNMPGFAEACQAAHDNKLIEHVGLHIVLTEGAPLTDGIKRCSRFCDGGGRFCYDRSQPIFKLETLEKEALGEEISAQIELCRQHGLLPTHIDSHIHVHTEFGIGKLLVRIAKTKKVPFIRLSRNCGPGISFAKRVYKILFNHMIKTAGLAAVRYFGSVGDCLHFRRQKGRLLARHSFELMIHPMFDEAGTIVDGTSNEALHDLISQVDGHHTAISFWQASR